MNPRAREEALELARQLRRSISEKSMKDLLTAVFEEHGANARTAWTNAVAVYDEVVNA